MCGEKKPTPGVSSRRSACDRCRGQKLRCLRKGGDPQGRCDRCAKADTACTTSPIYRMRNYSVDDDGSSVSRKRRRQSNRSSSVHHSPSPQIVAASASTSSPGGGSPTPVPALPLPESQPTTAAAQTTSAATGAATQTFVWHFEDVMQKPNGTDGVTTANFAMAPPPPDWATFPDPATPPAFSTPMVTSVDVWDHHDLTMAHLYAAENADKNINTSFNGPASGSPMPQHTYATSHPHQAVQLHQPHTPDAIHWSSHTTPHQEPMTDYFTPQIAHSPSLMSYQSNEMDDASHDHMQLLTNINLDLATQLKQITQPHVNIHALVSPSSGNPDPSSNTIIESILNLTQEFLHILDDVARTPQPHTPLPTPAIPTSWSGGTYGTYCNGSENGSITTYESSDMNSPSDSSGVTHYASPASSSMSPPPLSAATIRGFDHGRSSPALSSRSIDPAAVLLIISCYVHVLRIYVALFWHIQHHLQLTSADANERAMDQFGTFSLQSGNLQVNMVIQLVTNTFERMEAILGLPKELCLGGISDYYNNNACDDGQQQQLLHPNHYHHAGGMLGDEGLLDVARTIIGKEDVGRPEEGKGGIRSLRRDIMRARHSLGGLMTP
ncbi:uncharacterized protein PG998_012225 [Apiospora kogelbergensis]|uniref:uncharacterized protein n=1 Tax=Apiospora kogelbergensis TaxID=1337665 RepID=UPI0031314FED